MSRWLAGMLAGAALAPLALPAHAVAETFTTTGSITFTWHGDPARGCAAEGLCAVQGELTLAAQGSVSVESFGANPRRIDAPLESSGSTARVLDGAGAGECLDVVSGPGGENDLRISRGAGGRLVGHIGPSLSSGRCAGPLRRDLAALALPVRASGGKRPSYDLGGSRSFVAGPFRGDLVSTLSVRTGPGGSESVTSGPVPVGPPPAHKVFVERVALRYRIASLPGTLDTSFSGEPDPFCSVLDSCGANGSLAVSAPGLDRAVGISASRVVPRRVSAGQALADLRLGRLSIEGGVPATGPVPTHVSETFVGGDGLRCGSAASSHQVELFISGARGSRGAAVALAEPTDTSVLRTYCPGPADTDVFQSGRLAKTSIRLGQLLARHSVISLTGPGRFNGVGYVGSRSGELRFSLTLEHVSASTVEETRS